MTTQLQPELNGLFYTIAAGDAANSVITGLAVANVAVSSNLTVATGGLKLAGGTAGQVLAAYGNGSTYWLTPSSSGTTGTVTSVATTGTGLGFSLTGGPITTTGTVTLNIPTAPTLRTNLGLGNIATINATGSTTTFLRADGTWATPAGGSGTTLPSQSGNTGKVLSTDGTNPLWIATSGVGTVTNVGANGSGLGFSLGGTVTASGNITLTTPSSTGLKASLGIGNIAGINLNGSASQVLYGNGVFAAQSGGGGGSGSNVPNLTNNTNQWMRGDGWATLPVGNIATINLDGSTTTVLYGNGVFSALPTTLTAGNNISITGGVINMDSLKYAKEPIVTQTTPYITAVNIDVLTSSITYNSAVATSPVAINIRGNGTTTLASMLAVDQLITVTALITNGPTPQSISSVTIDGTTQTVKMLGGADMSGVASSIVAYTFTVIKTSGGYTVIGSKAGYK